MQWGSWVSPGQLYTLTRELVSQGEKWVGSIGR